MSLDMDDLRQRAAQELSGPEEELVRYRHAFQEHDPEGTELLDELAEYLKKNFVVSDQILRDPTAVALQCALGREDPEIMEKGRDLLSRLTDFREETGHENPLKDSNHRFIELQPKNNE